jgi:hypothetical protein
METPNSKRHHYVPEFYLRSFTNESGFFYVFDKQTEKIRKAYPKEYFYGWNRNTGYVGEEKSSLLESMYGYFESTIAPHYEAFKNATDLSKVDLASFFHVLRFIHFLYWRIPENDFKLEKLIEEKAFTETGFDIIDKTTGKSAATIELQNQLKNVDLFRKMYRVFIPLLSSRKEYSKTDIENWQLYTRSDGNNLTGDSPIIIKRFVDFSSLNEELMFPLAKNKILIHTKGNKPAMLPASFKLHFDMLLLQQATRYVCCSNKEYLELLVNDLYSFSKNHDFLEQMKNTAFSHFPTSI